ncbi:MAG TPA: replicative DNA helicase [Spirochaetota bacterium]|nr:replicative DNA helicase [Spirochaetota bacterium]
MSPDRLPPQDIDTESACLAAALLNREALLRVTEILLPEDFYLERYRTIFQAIIELEQKNLPVDLATLKQKLRDQNILESIGGDATLVDLYQSASTSANAEFYAKRIKELSVRRKLIDVATDSIEKCYDMMIDTEELIDTVEKDIFDVTEKQITGEIQNIGDVMDDTLNLIGKWVDTKKIVTGVASGFGGLDELLTGFHGSELIIVAARPGMGKTAFALNVMNHIALRESQSALFFSLEMPSIQLGMRMLCIEAMIDSHLVRTGRISGEEVKKLMSAAQKFKKTAPIFIDDTPSSTILQMRKKARRMAKSHKLGVIIVDYLQLISGPSRMERHQQIAEISRSLKQMARDLDVPVIALSQLSRAVESRTDQMPTLADLRESGAIEQDADVVLFIYREEKVKKDSPRKGEADIVIAKQRNGPVGTVPLIFWEKFTKFGTPDRIHSFEETRPSNELQ